MEKTFKVNKYGNVLHPINEENITFADLFKDYKEETKQEEYWIDERSVGKEIFYDKRT